MDEDLSKYIDLDILPNKEKEKEKIETIEAEVIKSIVKPEKVNLAALELGSFSYMKQSDLEKRIYLWFLNGWTDKKIKDELVNNWGIVQEKTVDLLIKRVNKTLKKTHEEDVDLMRDKFNELYMDLYSKAVERKDYLTAQKILDSLTRLQGLSVKRTETKTETVYKIVYDD